MAYADLLSDPSVEQNMLVVMRPRLRASGVGTSELTWANYSGNISRAPFPHGFPARVTSAGTEKTQGSAAGTLASGEWYFDPAESYLYYNMGSAVTPDNNNNVFLVVEYELYFATRDFNWYRVPTDSTKTQVHFAGVIMSPPVVRATMEDSIAGFIPATSSSLQVADSDGLVNKLIHSSSFSRAPVEVYHLLGSLKTANIRKVYKALVSSVEIRDGEASFEMIDHVDVLNQNFNGYFFSSSRYTASTIDPGFIGRPIPVVYGRKKGVRCINVDFVSDTTLISTSNNRKWAVCGHDVPAAITAGVGAGAHTTTVTFLSSNSADSGSLQGQGGVRRVTFYTGAFTNMAYAEMQPTGVATTQRTHSAIAAPRASGDFALFYPITDVNIIQDGTVYKCFPKIHYTYAYDSTGPFTYIQLVNNVESLLGMSRTITPTDTVTCTVLGKSARPTISGSSFGSLNSNGSYDNLAVVLYDVLGTYLGISESDIDTATFQTVASALSSDGTTALKIPELSTDDFPGGGEVIGEILRSAGLRLYLNSDLKWTIARVIEITGQTATVDLTDDDIVEGSLAFQYRYEDVVTDFVVERDVEEIPGGASLDGARGATHYSTNTWARYLHGVTRSRSVRLCLRSNETPPEAFSSLADRQCRVSFRGNHALNDAYISSVLQITRTRLPGNAYDGTTEYSRKFSIVATDKTLGSVSVTADDQKGIEDN